ncbi:type II toxin-antitoxin system HipA family toxin [Sphingopyxis sp. GW247-27LB]|uniref:type II toxin-antitoxin system HipA family toxin n=1 Tax=Sphingopyxis sp. GW247-27LB TaxID=2012632 RepID=UPI000BA74EA3|nr:HipA domain-containing protein [Sphingopyxis sp. GW247-27LB]PAL20868.1 phosphatidylinositol kinase [Sphingopyxis sp. GW247-27LB]
MIREKHSNFDRRSRIADREAIVTYKGARAGLLSEAGRGSHFAYDDGWTADIACALPATKRDHVSRDALIPFFEHLGPEGWLRGLQARAGGAADQDDFGILLQYGADCIGAVGILPSDGIAPVHHLDGSVAEEAAVTASRTISGVQRKLLAWRDEATFRPSVEASDPATHIAKFNHNDEPTLVQNEALSLRLAREILGENEVTRAEPAVVAGIEGLALLVERFDRVDGERLRLEDFAQILGKPRGPEFGGKYDASYEEAASVIAHFSSRARLDLVRYFKLVVFNLALGNADAHLKNFSLLERPEGLRLSPAYDLLNTLLYPFNRETALEIGGRKREFDTLSRPIVEAFGAEIGLPKAAVDLALGELAKRLTDPKTLRFAARVDEGDFRARFKAGVEENSRRILA